MAALIRWRPGRASGWNDPYRNVAQLQRDMNRLWDSIFTERERFPGSGVYPALNVSEDNECLFVRAELPGFDPKSLDISIQEDNLVLKGERRIEQEDDKAVYHRRERESGTFRRILSLPVAVDHDKITANFSDGMLTVTLPKAPESKPRRVKVTTG
jgi:HSP20 family protein